jgi:hypothetical protein
MKFWDDSLRICPKCKEKVSLKGEDKIVCPQCKTKVWFYNFREIPSPPEIPKPELPSLWKNPITSFILIATLILSLAASSAIHQTLFISAISLMVAVAFGVVAFIRHVEATKIEDSLAYLDKMRKYGTVMSDRVRELSSRHNSLLRTGNSYIENYYQEIYIQAENERNK